MRFKFSLGLIPTLLTTTFAAELPTEVSSELGSSSTSVTAAGAAFGAHHEAEWKEIEAGLVHESPQWYVFIAETYEKRAEWDPDQRDDYLKERDRYLKLADQAHHEAKWKEIEAGLVHESPEWYTFMAETCEKRAEWDPDYRDYYLKLRYIYLKRADQVYQEAKWKEIEAGLVHESPQWYAFMAETYEKRAEWESEEQDDDHKKVVDAYLKRADELRQEAKWKEIEAGLVHGSPQWYAFMAETCEKRAEWDPDQRDYYLKLRDVYLEQADQAHQEAVLNERKEDSESDMDTAE